MQFVIDLPQLCDSHGLLKLFEWVLSDGYQSEEMFSLF